MADPIQLQDWIPVLNASAERLIRTPVHLAHLKRSDVDDLAATFPAEQPALLLWQALSSQTGGFKPTSADGRSVISPAHLESSFRGKRLNQTNVAKARESSMAMLGLPSGFDGLGPVAKIRKLGETPHAPETMEAFLNTGSQLNLLRRVQDSLSSVDAEIHRCGHFSTC